MSDPILLVLAILAAVALASLLLSPRRRIALALGLIGAAGASAILAAEGVRILAVGVDTAPLITAWPLPLGHFSIGADALSAWFLVALGVLSLAVSIYAWGYWAGEGDDRGGGIQACLLNLLIGSILLSIVGRDVITFLLGWEGMALSGYALINTRQTDPATRHAAWIYLVAMHLGTALGVLPMFGILIARAGGQTGFDAIALSAANLPASTATLVFALALLGFGTKAGIMPMHVWLAHAHPAAPSPVSALLSGIVIKMGLYGLLRLLEWLPALPVGCAVVMILLGSVAGITGILQAIGQRHLKRLLAFSSVENVGIIVIAVGAGMLGRTSHQPILQALGFGGALLHILNHAMFKGLLFLSAGAIVHATGTGLIERMGGLLRKTPVNGWLFILGALAICALPPLNGFLGEWVIYLCLLGGAASLDPAHAWVAVVAIAALALIGGLTLACCAKVVGVAMLGETRDPAIHPHRTPASMALGMMLLAAACLAIGLFGPFWLATMMPAVAPSAATWDSVAPSLARLQWIIAIGVVAAILLALGRRAILRRHGVAPDRGTWGCAYAYPTPRMQYSAGSFTDSIRRSFAAAAPTVRSGSAVQGYFPVSASLSTHTPDPAEDRLFAPIFRAVLRFSQWLAPLQRGRIQLYLVYIVITLIVVLIVESARG